MGPVEPADAPDAPIREAASRYFSGRVVDPAGAALAGAFVTLFPVRDGVPALDGGAQHVKCSERGQFRMDVPEWARTDPVLLVAVGRGLRPFSLITRLDDEFLAREHELALGVGFTISGRLIRDGHPVAGASIRIDAGFDRVLGNGTGGWWVDGRFENMSHYTDTSQDGTFELQGMGPELHQLTVRYVQGTYMSFGGWEFTTTAPSDRDYDLTRARLAVTVQGGQGPIAGLELLVTTDRGLVTLETSEVPVVVEVPPGSKVELSGSHPNIRSLEARVDAPGAGQTLDVVIPVELVTRPSLVVRLPGATQSGIEYLRLSLQPVGLPSGELLCALAESVADTYRVVLVMSEPGEYVLVLQPNGDSAAGCFIAPRAARVLLPAAGEVQAEFDLDLYGRCAIDISGPPAQPWSAIYRLIDPEGRVQLVDDIYQVECSFPVCWTRGSRHEPHPYYSRLNVDEQMSSARSAQSHRVYPPGVYTLEVESDGHRKQTRTVIIEAAKTAKIAIELEPL